jgi:imidazole glycerol-phosphate synthase subunit HisH
MITIINYGLGNIRAFVNVYNQLNIPIHVATGVTDLKIATKLILPGVGAFDNAMERLNNSGMRPMLDKMVLDSHIPIMGICVGMQILAHFSEEGNLPGLGWINGGVKKINPPNWKQNTHLPHMGWNDILITNKNQLFEGLEQNARFYFLHSYYFQCQNSDNVSAVAEYGEKFACAINSGNIYGVQFHPEKSHHCGIQLLKNFANL